MNIPRSLYEQPQTPGSPHMIEEGFTLVRNIVKTHIPNDGRIRMHTTLSRTGRTIEITHFGAAESDIRISFNAQRGEFEMHGEMHTTPVALIRALRNTIHTLNESIHPSEAIQEPIEGLRDRFRTALEPVLTSEGTMATA